MRTSLLLIDQIRRLHQKEFAWGKSIDRLTGSDKVRLAIDGGTLPALLEEWDREARRSANDGGRSCSTTDGGPAYSYRSATVGATCDARRAGRSVATSATTAMTTAAPPNATAS